MLYMGDGYDYGISRCGWIFLLLVGMYDGNL